MGSKAARVAALRVDAPDLRILRAMGLLPFERPREAQDLRPSAWARRARVSPKVLRERVARLREDGILAGFEAYPNLNHLGLRWTTFHFRLPRAARKRDVIADVEAVDGVVAVMNFIGADLCVDVLYADGAELARRLKVLRSLTGAAWSEWYDNRMPAARRPLEPLDWRILAALRGRADRPAREVAAELRVSEKTVKRRFGAMLARGDADVVPTLDLGRISRTIPFALLYQIPAAQVPRASRAILAEHEERYLWAWRPPAAELASFVVVLCASRTQEIERLREEAEERSGATLVEAIVPCGGVEAPGWLSAAVARAAPLSENAPGRASGGQRTLARVRR